MISTLLLLSFLACNKDTAEVAAPAPKADAAPGDVPAPSDVAAPPADAIKTESGLAYKVLTPGTGTEKPVAADSVEVNYTGWTTDGKMFDSSTKRNKTAKFAVKGVIKGWTEGLQLMTVGQTNRFWIPTELAYNDKPGKPAGMLVFDVELVSITAAPKPIPAPDDVAAAPADAKKTKSGLAYKVLVAGTGKGHPTAESVVEVDYTGWSKDGTMFDSSVTRGKPASFPLGRVIPGWTEGVQLMVVGDKMRFWIPADLAYGAVPKRPGAPSGDLVFDIELKEIKEATATNPTAGIRPGPMKPGTSTTPPGMKPHGVDAKRAHPDK
ncbi:MAG: FKBP-type peptidyl-prolyl cis-trans isomerase [Pseudomonadota bacterium]|nr:FKBP-type peptidyl-prolyl cis-trans isomerase [Pseudomonadota bacterium]